jgi:RNA-splicing ligase RtcB
MPDTHSGVGCVIGTTMTILNKIVPNLVGVDIGCGMLTIQLPTSINLTQNNLSQIDTYITQNIPCGFNINPQPHTNFKEQIQSLICFRDLAKSSAEFNRAIGSLGGGNHFIEINTNEQTNTHYLVIHSGSRNLGQRVATHYQNKAYDYHNGLDSQYEEARISLIQSLKSQNRKHEIQSELAKLKQQYKKECTIDKELCYLEGKLMQDYLHDMKIVQEYANLNRYIIGKRIVEEHISIPFDSLYSFQTIHNYIDIDNMILRKGAISSQENEIVLIPINMRDGSLICKGKGNPNWNYSAPHGAGRLMSRTQAKQNISLTDFEDSMKEVFTTSVNESTIDESAFAYKPMDEIINNIQDTVEILSIIKPIYNFKAH